MKKPLHFSNNYLLSAIKEQTSSKQLVKVTSVLGKQKTSKSTTPILCIYDDVTVEKQIIIE